MLACKEFIHIARNLQLSKEALWQTESRISIQVVFGISLVKSKTILCSVSFVWQQNAKSNLRAVRNKEISFISKGFSNWK